MPGCASRSGRFARGRCSLDWHSRARRLRWRFDVRIAAHRVEVELGAFLALKEYRPGPRLRPGFGLFAPRSVPLPLQATRFHPSMLQVGRRGQTGYQYFFTASGRPRCLYAVIDTAPRSLGSVADAHHRVGELSRTISTLKLRERS
jgi:hypothetical protein